MLHVPLLTRPFCENNLKIWASWLRQERSPLTVFEYGRMRQHGVVNAEHHCNALDADLNILRHW